MSSLKDQAIASAIFVFVLGIVILVYFPGISGPFLVDDYVHLPRLSQYGGIDSLRNLLRFGFENAGASGRPISYLSFALNDQYWPSSPEPFKYTNICIHLLNAVLVFVLGRRLFTLVLDDRRMSNILALALMAIWALHPIQQSSVLYIIQRMTELSALFVLTGLIVYLRGRLLLPHKPLLGFLLMSLGTVVFGGLAILSKETGVLIVLYILVIEGTLIRGRFVPASDLPSVARYLTLWKVTFLYLPIAAVVGYYFLRWEYMQSLWDIRSYGPEERLLTQARALSSYLWQTVAPRLHGSGLFHDDYAHSTGLFSPPTTFFAVLVVSSLLFSALFFRKRYPVYAFGILWWFAGHTLESTLLPLELYFEHRSYLPSLGLFFALLYLVYSFAHRRPDLRRPVLLATAAILISVTALTALNVKSWGNERLLYEIAAKENPGSVRARLGLANYWAREGYMDEALDMLADLKTTYPDKVGLHLTQLFWQCVANVALDRQDDLSTSVGEIIEKIPRAVYEHASYQVLKKLRQAISAGRCKDVTPSDLRAIHATFEEHPPAALDARTRSFTLLEIGRAYALARDLNGAVTTLDRAYEAHPIPDIPMFQAIWLFSAGLPDEGRRYLEKAENTPSLSRYLSVDDSQRIHALAEELEKAYAKQ